MAKPREISKGEWRLDSCYKRNRKTFRGKTAKEVKEKEKLWIRELDDHGTTLKSSKYNFIELTKEYLFVMVKNNVAAGTFEKYMCQFEVYIKPCKQLNKDIKDIKVSDVQQLINSMLENSKSNIKGVKIILNGAFEYAMADDLVRSNPCKSIKLPKGYMQSNNDVEYFTMHERDKYLDTVKDTIYYELIVLALSTGMRQGELTALTWDNVDFKNDMIYVRESARRCRVYDNDGNFEYKNITGSTKTSNSVRDIPIAPDVKVMLKKLKLKNGASKYVFLSAKGEQIKNNTLQKMHSIFCKRAGVKHIKFHALRHTFATMAIEQGVNVKTLSELMGHSDVSITLNLYVHTDDTNKREAIKKVSKLISTL